MTENLEIIVRNINSELNLNDLFLRNTISLIDEGATIPFIARYRKERTGGLDEVQIREIFTKFEYYTELEKRKETIIKTIEEQGKLTPELEKSIRDCKDRQTLEDIYLPYKPKKRTRASIAREKGLEGLAEAMLDSSRKNEDKNELIGKYINPEKGVNNEEEAIAGAMDIIAERVSEDTVVRAFIRDFTKKNGTVDVKPKKEWKEKKSKFETYYDFSENIEKSPSHRILAIRRGEKEGVLSFKLVTESEGLVNTIERKLNKDGNPVFKNELKEAAAESFKRLIYPSIENEVFGNKIESAESTAIEVFAKNLENLILSAPAGQKVILGVDPGFRTGCKLAVIDKNGDFKEYKAIFPTEPQNRVDESEKVVKDFCERYEVELIAIGNGTASRETEKFIKNCIKKYNLKADAVMVSEAGASVYSASPLAASEFPDLDLTVRGAISIARRLQDPLAELVKIDPKSIGVGQYQHDINQANLKKSLDMIVESCVNKVGVELNTASESLLSYVSGLNSTIAKNIVNFRTEHGGFKNRKEIIKVAKLGEKSFEQCAGFLRIRDSKNPLDNSSIHPEAYHIVEQMAKDLSVEVKTLIGNNDLIKKIDLKKYISDDFGLPTLKDIIDELKKPGRDPRDKFENVKFNDSINEIGDLNEGMTLEGVITNVTAFGAFVDIGVHQDGLVHISKLSDSFVRDPAEIVSVGDKVIVKVLSVDKELKRISLERIGAVN